MTTSSHLSEPEPETPPACGCEDTKPPRLHSKFLKPMTGGKDRRHRWGREVLLRKMLENLLPIGSMCGIFTYIWVIYRANVSKYSIHGASGLWCSGFRLLSMELATSNIEACCGVQLCFHLMMFGGNVWKCVSILFWMTRDNQIDWLFMVSDE